MKIVKNKKIYTLFQADLIRYLKEHNAKLNEKVISLSTELQGKIPENSGTGSSNAEPQMILNAPTVNCGKFNILLVQTFSFRKRLTQIK